MKGNIPHAFLGLTRKHPNELDTIKYEKEITYWDYNEGKMKLWRKEEIKWYENFENVEFNDGFYGFAPVESSVSHWGKVFENNHFVPQWNENIKNYDYALRDKSTFDKSNRCVFEVSQEQYEFLLDEIKKEVAQTSNRNPNLQQDNSKMISLETLKENLYYNSMPFDTSLSLPPIKALPLHNCTTWVLHKLDSIGIEVFNIKEWIPDIPVFKDLKELFPYLKFCNSTFLKFQAIDSNLESIKGAKAFREWARTFIQHPCFHQLYIENNPSLKNMDLDQEQKDLILKVLFNVKEIYNILDIILQTRLDKIVHTDTKGDFELIYYDRQENKIKSLKAENDYNPIAVENFDLNIPANNCSISKFYPFIFIPRDKILSRMLYHKYDYGKVSESYQEAANEFYLNVLAGIQSDKYWSKSYHKLSKINKQFQVQTKEIENV
jgi:hypothetical protein